MALTTFHAAPGSSDHQVVEIRRVSRTVKGGRRFRFRAAVVVGDRNGRVGFGLRKGKDVRDAVEKARAAAEKSKIEIPRRERTIPHEVRAHYRGADVLLKPAPPGAGIIAGGVVRAVAALAGIQDLSSKIMGSHNKVNVTRAVLKALLMMKPTLKALTSPTGVLESGHEEAPKPLRPADAGGPLSAPAAA